jgi:hypothetical protein
MNEFAAAAAALNHQREALRSLFGLPDLPARRVAAITEAWRRHEIALGLESMPDDVIESFARVALQALDQRGELR